MADREALRSVAGHFGFEVGHHPLQRLDDVAGAVGASVGDGADALYVSGEPLLYNNMARVLPLVTAPGKPTVGTYPDWARAGLLMSYSAESSRRRHFWPTRRSSSAKDGASADRQDRFT